MSLVVHESKTGMSLIRDVSADALTNDGETTEKTALLKKTAQQKDKTGYKMTKEVINQPFLDCAFVSPGSSYSRRSEISLRRKVAVLNCQNKTCKHHFERNHNYAM